MSNKQRIIDSLNENYASDPCGFEEVVAGQELTDEQADYMNAMQHGHQQADEELGEGDWYWDGRQYRLA